MNELLIFDLDDTLFETKSIEKKSVQPIFDEFEKLLHKQFDKELIEQILPELWKYPFDYVSDKYQFDNHQNTEFARLIYEHDYKFTIKPFEDFSEIQKLQQEKILVTTGFTKLQNAKIHSLGIEKEFVEIYIDNILDSKRIYKKGIFKNILLEKKIRPELVYIIGDNSNSELKAGFELGLNVVQVSKFNQPKSEYADYCISDFSELVLLLRKQSEKLKP
jgi:putative hydrolase of the HAD superfamily